MSRTSAAAAALPKADPATGRRRTARSTTAKSTTARSTAKSTKAQDATVRDGVAQDVTAEPARSTRPGADDASASLDVLMQRGRAQGHLSLAEVRAAFSEAGITPAEGRSILRELTDAGVRLADESDDASQAGEVREDDTPEDAVADATEMNEADLDDQSTVMGDSVHTYLKAIGRTALLTAEQEVDLAKRIEAGLYAEFKLEQAAEDGTELPAELREDLESVAEDGQRAKAHMLEANLRLVVSVAKKYGDRGLSLLDIVQEGNLGLIRAVEKFDYTKGYKFSTYAMWWIRQAIQRGFADSARTIRLPVHVLELLSKLSRIERDMHQALGREPTPEELAKELDKSPEQIEELLRTTRQPISLNATIGEDGETSIGDLIEDTDAVDASAVVDHQLMTDQLKRALADLEPREATIMSLRFGLVDGKPHTLDEIGRHLGLTRERIRQLEKESLSKLRHPSRAMPLLDFAS